MQDRRESQNSVYGNVILINPTVKYYYTINYYHSDGGTSKVDSEDFVDDVAANVAAGLISEFGFWVLHITIQLSTLLRIDIPLITRIIAEVFGRLFGVKD